ncbi:unnamed protein product [Rhodiola kirilowii]
MEEKDEGDVRVVAQKLFNTVNEIAAISVLEFRPTVKKHYCNLARRLKLLTPLFEEIKDCAEPIPEDSFKALISLADALDAAKDILRLGTQASKIYLVLEREQVMTKFLKVTTILENALSGISYEKLDISEEVKEQVEFVIMQFKRAKERVDEPDVELYEDLLSLYNRRNNAASDAVVLRRCAGKLQLTRITDLTDESLALHEMVATSGGDPGEIIEKMSMLLKMIKDFVQTDNPNMHAPSRDKLQPSEVFGQASSDLSNTSIIIPEDFRCPISLELMKDPVIVSTGQTYERDFIEKWLKAGHLTCPKTQQPLTNTTLTPNYVLRSLIGQWCEANGMEPPKRPVQSSKATAGSSPTEHRKIETLLRQLASANPDDMRAAAGEIRLLAKRNADNRVAIAEAGAIPLLVRLLSVPDSRIQEHAVTALLNLSIHEHNKGNIVASGGVPGIIHVLRKGSMEARENAAAAIFSLSIVDGNKVTIGSMGAIPPLVTLLNEGSPRGRKDAATALFNLCIYQGNKGRAIRAGVIPTLIRLLKEPANGMVDEALAMLSILASHFEGKAIIGASETVPTLVEVIGNGSPRNKENAAAVLVHLCSGDPKHLADAQELGVMGSLLDMALNGTDRGKRKAAQLLERISRISDEVQKNEAEADATIGTRNEEPSQAQVQPVDARATEDATSILIPHLVED